MACAFPLSMDEAPPSPSGLEPGFPGGLLPVAGEICTVLSPLNQPVWADEALRRARPSATGSNTASPGLCPMSLSLPVS